MITAASSAMSNVIIRQQVKLILQWHTHGASLVWNDYGAWSGKTGCMCRMGDYTSDPKLRTPRPWCPGYVVTEQSGAITNINATRFVSLRRGVPGEPLLVILQVLWCN